MKVDNKSFSGRALMVLAVLAIIGVAGLIGGCTSLEPKEHREDKTSVGAAANIVIDVRNVNGNVEVRELAGTDRVEITYDIFAAEGHLDHVQTGMNSTRVDNDTVMVIVEAKVNKAYEKEIASHGANIIVTVPKGSHVELKLATVNGDITVPALNGSSLTAGTTNGNVVIDGGNYSGIEARTTNGDVTVKLPAGTLFHVDASTVNGRVRHSDIHMAPTTENDRTLIGPTEAGSGSLRLSLHTVNGNVGISY